MGNGEDRSNVNGTPRGPVLLTSLGLSWAVVPELYGLTNPGRLDLYARHPEAARLAALRERYAVEPVNEVWAVTTARFDSAPLKAWREALLPAAPALRVWRLEGTPDLQDDEDCRAMTDLVFRAALRSTGRGCRYFSLAGGRKTMSADMQRAADTFGCDLLLHVMDRELPPAFHRLSPGDLAVPLEAAFAASLMPVVVGGKVPSNPVLDVPLPDRPAIRPENFPCGLPPPDGTPLDVPRRTDLAAEVEHRLGRARNLLFHFAHRLREEERGAAFSALYHLPPRVVHRLREARLGLVPENAEAELTLLRPLPKAELHCHLGGALSAGDLVALARAHDSEMARYEDVLRKPKRAWRDWVDSGDPGRIREMLSRQLRTLPSFDSRRPWRSLGKAAPGVPEPLAACAFLRAFEGREELLDGLIHGDYRMEAQFVGVDIEPYETLGDFQGSTLLQGETALRFAAGRLLALAEAHRVLYLEVRCSPENYTRGGLSSDEVVRVLRDAFTRWKDSGPAVSLIIIASRHGDFRTAERHKDLACRLLDEDPGGILAGFDLAGDEERCPAERMRPLFLPLMDRCLHLTIHAGETADAGSVWQAVYHLSAERIGHGLTLAGRPELVRKVAERRITVEMCPSSNVQTVGYRDAFLPGTEGRPTYPLRTYLDEGLRVAVCTDNPGISRTDFTRELHRAARLTPGGLSPWEILGVIRIAFRSSFAPRELRRRCLVAAEAETVRLLEEDAAWRNFLQGDWP